MTPFRFALWIAICFNVGYWVIRPILAAILESALAALGNT